MESTPMLFKNEDAARRALDRRELGVVVRLLEWWRQFHPYADSRFVPEINEAVTHLNTHFDAGEGRSRASWQFHQRWWEMCVGCALLEQGVALVPRRDWPAQVNAGPDLLANLDDHRIWIECAAPGPGTGADRVRDPQGDECEIADEHIDAIQLRFLNAIAEKRKQHQSHIENRVVGADDRYVLAINTWAVSHLTDIPVRAPWMAEALYGFRGSEIRFNSLDAKEGEVHLPPRRHISKSNTAKVGTDLFGSGEACEISAILFSAVDAHNCQGSLARQISVVHNETAAVRLPDRWLPMSEHWAVEERKSRRILYSIPPQSCLEHERGVAR